jgi:STE24 endopeptidase
MKSSVAVFSIAASFFLGVCADVRAQETSPAPTISSSAPSIAPNADPATATRAWLDTVPADKRAKSDAYFEGGYWLILWNFLMTTAISLFLLGSRISARMRDFAERKTRFKAMQVALYAILFVLLTTLLAFPLHVYEDFFREHTYGLATQNFSEWFVEQLKGLAFQLVFTALALIGLYAVFRRAPKAWWIWGTVVTIFFLLIGAIIAPVYVEPVFNKYKPLTDPSISEPIRALARANEIPVNQVFEVDASRQSNRVSANVSGFLGTTRIALNDNLLKQCTLPEIREVMGHEMGHYVLNHTTKLINSFGIFILLAFAAARGGFDFILRRWGEHWGLRVSPAAGESLPDDGATSPSETAKVIAQPSAVYGIADPASLPLLSLIFAAVFFLLTPLTNTVTRTFEREADAFGLNTSREPDGMAKVALKLGTYRKLDPTPLEEFIFFDHPSGRARIQMAMDWKAAHLPCGGSDGDR